MHYNHFIFSILDFYFAFTTLYIILPNHREPCNSSSLYFFSFANIQAHLDMKISEPSASPDVRPKFPPLSHAPPPSSQATPTITAGVSKGKPIKGVLKKPKE